VCVSGVVVGDVVIIVAVVHVFFDDVVGLIGAVSCVGDVVCWVDVGDVGGGYGVNTVDVVVVVGISVGNATVVGVCVGMVRRCC